jgi:hypothetical protein
MNRNLKVIVPVVMLFAAVTLSQAQYGGGGSASTPVLKFSTMVGVGGAFLAPNDVRGVVGDTLPWTARSIKGSLLANGRLTIKVRGLVFPMAPPVPPELQGINDEPQFQAIVSCVVDDGQGGLVTTNMTTAGFPATTKGNANITATVTLPAACAAPIVFVTGGGGQWFAMTGVKPGG